MDFKGGGKLLAVIGDEVMRFNNAQLATLP